MRKKNVKGKLSLNKETVAKLTEINGGAKTGFISASAIACPTTTFQTFYRCDTQYDYTCADSLGGNYTCADFTCGATERYSQCVNLC